MILSEADFFEFGKYVERKYKEKFPERQDSWKDMSISDLRLLLKFSADEIVLGADPNEAIDVALFACFLWKKLRGVVG